MCVFLVKIVKCTPWNPYRKALPSVSSARTTAHRHAWLVKRGYRPSMINLDQAAFPLWGCPCLHVASGRREMLRAKSRRNKWIGCFVGKQQQQLPRTFTLLFTGLSYNLLSSDGDHWGCNFLHLTILYHSPNISQILIIKMQCVLIMTKYLVSHGVFYDYLSFFLKFLAFPVLHSCLDFFFFLKFALFCIAPYFFSKFSYRFEKQ